MSDGKRRGPPQPLPCDFCRDPVAPFGYAPPPSVKKVRRPIWSCAAPVCMEKAEARRQAAIDAAGVFRDKPGAPAPPAAQVNDPDQKALL